MDKYAPKVAFDGTNYLVVWEVSFGSYNADVYGARVTPAGVVLDGDGIALATGSNDQVAPALACDGTNCLVVWQDTVNGGGTSYASVIAGVRVSKAGAVLGTVATAQPSPSADDQRLPDVAFNGMDYVIAWEQVGGILAARVGVDGTVLDSSSITLARVFGSSSNPSVACRGVDCLVTWRLSTAETPDELHGSTVSPDGTATAIEGVTLWTEVDPTIAGGPVLAFDGSNYLLVWETRGSRSDYSDLYAARVEPSAVLVDSVPFAVARGANGEGEPAAAFDGTNYLVVWQDSRNGNDDIYAARVGADATLLDQAPIVVSSAPNAQRRPRVAFDGKNYLVVWEDFRSDVASDIYAARISPAGTLLDPAGISVSAAAHDQRPRPFARDVPGGRRPVVGRNLARARTHPGFEYSASR